MPESKYITCEERVWTSGGFHSSRCSRKASVQRGDHWFCSTHDPVKRAEKDEAKRVKWAAEDKLRQDKWNREAAMRVLCDGVDITKLQSLGNGWVNKVLCAIAESGYYEEV